MLQNSKYSVWFRTPKGEGHGIISLLDGNLIGGDNISSYTGTYVQDGNEFTANIAVNRHTEGQPSVFDIDNVDITLSGADNRIVFWNRSAQRNLPSHPHPDRRLIAALIAARRADFANPMRSDVCRLKTRPR